MTVKQAADRLQISQSLCYKLVEEKRLACVRIGKVGRRGKIIIQDEDIDHFLRDCRRPAK